ncbi:growth-regulating factor 1-like [Zingiber officinale]|uniref:Growth-regulating factor n=1 Tax=Zingiber officinale TaxID=94328 RepID=A0A8J5HI07_ZINOF|nr:growth-regulating factor 1-like [Zingiber officinale]XP_042471516.1 growth-regulating factor 1-like [Zingiber officinale]KAG6517587.1 hypothetical protein ZIOFF_020983 [Zingiber officinale]KAG6520068.1 hypothetical protein ZIOFF_017098 [Zingiber officinale]
MMTGGGGSRYPFTPSQWQELELQALVFKYMASAIPVPPDLIHCIRRSLFMDPQTPRFLPNAPAIGWGGYGMGEARNAVDPEPGRCRRTDGKKWRCSKEAYPDSKYCERHMHRGKGRPRKPVELSLATSPAFSHNSPNFHPPLSLPSPHTNHLFFPCSSSVRPSARGLGYSHCEDSTNLCLESLPLSLDNHRNVVGFKEVVPEFPFLPEGCRNGMQIPPSFGPMGMNSKHVYSNMQSVDSRFRMCTSEEEKGADLKIEMAANGRSEKEDEEQKQPRPFHCFLDEKPPKMDGSWMSMDVGLKTQLSMSISIANHDMPVIASQCYNDG